MIGLLLLATASERATARPFLVMSGTTLDGASRFGLTVLPDGSLIDLVALVEASFRHRHRRDELLALDVATGRLRSLEDGSGLLSRLACLAVDSRGRDFTADPFFEPLPRNESVEEWLAQSQRVLFHLEAPSLADCQEGVEPSGTIFSDGFENGTSWAWSASSPP